MRPVRLEMHGFAAFREPTVVDFAGAEYFALVGPTGSGKSTVIDALTFALYGTVPRWDDRRAVALGLAPSATRGVVRLVFDVRGGRYVAARELRRAAKGGVNVKNARLERLLDHADLEGPTEVMAADSGVTKAVEQLLGLPFEHFTSCVVLPQGQFAEFLHAKPGDRQAILTRLLGLGVYERIAREANQEAAAAGNRAALLAEQLGAYADATDEAVAAADTRVAALTELSEQVTALLPAMEAAAAAVAEADAAVATLRGEQARLGALVVPHGLAALDGRRRAAEERAESARDRFATAEAADDAARKLVADAPARAPLERARRDHSDLAAAEGARPAGVATHAEAVRAEEGAARAVAVAEEEADRATAARDDAARALAAARTVVEQLGRERALLASVRPPADIDASARRQADAVAAVEAADARLLAADAADAEARRRLAAAPPSGPLEQARRDHAALAAAEDAEPEARHRHAEADRSRQAAATAVAQARHGLAHARAQREESARSDHAAALRPTLVAGEPCPVCTQEVATLPPPLPGEDPAEHEAAVAVAQDALEDALAAEAAAVAAERQAGADRERVAREIARLRAELATLGHDDPASVEAALAEREALAAAATTADGAVRRARRDRDDATTAADAARAELRAAAVALRTARDPLVALGVPGAADDPATGWAELTAWVASALAERDEAAPEADHVMSTAARAADHALRAAEAAAIDLTGCRRALMLAARAEEQARNRLEALDGRIEVLRTSLAGAPAATQVDDDLARLDALEAGARTADADLRAARGARAEAEEAAEAVRREVSAGWEALRRARDPLVPLDAPAADGDDLAAAWTVLTTWATRQTADREARLPGALAAVEVARAQSAAQGERLAGMLAAEGVAAAEILPRGARPGAADHAGGPATMSGRTAEAAVAAALAGARADRGRLAERRAEAAGKRAEQADAEEAQQVAKMLGGLLRSDRFPRWLVASALDALVVDASAGLAQLSGGQFELAHDEGEFLVVDHADADARRPVKTLSGGETFQASLALALALSAQMSTLAAEGAARLDSIFLDEGFGTLDEANLDVVAGTLENLASRGDRMVGVITHVPGLAERVPVRFVVRRDQRSARIEREGIAPSS